MYTEDPSIADPSNADPQFKLLPRSGVALRSRTLVIFRMLIFAISGSPATRIAGHVLATNITKPKLMFARAATESPHVRGWGNCGNDEIEIMQTPAVWSGVI
jgi:hypothetical protein